MKSPNAARQIGNTYGSISGVYSFRNDKIIPYESTLERDFLIKTSWCDSVLDVQEQPLIIPYRTALGRESTYTPDFLIHYRTSSLGLTPPSVLVEVKPKIKLDQEFSKLRLKFKAGIKYAKTQGWKYRIYHEDRIRDEKLDNIAYLQRFYKLEYPAADISYLMDGLEEMGHCPMDSFLAIMYAKTKDRAIGQSLIWHLIATKKMACPMHIRFRPNMPIWVNSDPGYLTPSLNSDWDDFSPSEVYDEYE